MTKYILHGGRTSILNENNKAFYQEWVKELPNKAIANILLVYFFREKEKWSTLEQQDRERFANYTNNRQANFVMAIPDLHKLRDQIKAADIIYVRGGSSDKLLQALTPLKEEFSELLQGKTYVGSSAGVMLLCHYAASANSDWKSGLGILPINSLVHWDEKFREKLELFKENHKDADYEYLLIPETEFVVRSY